MNLRVRPINLTTNMSSCSLQPLAVQLQQSLTAIRTELQSAIAHADDSNFTTGRCIATRELARRANSTHTCANIYSMQCAEKSRLDVPREP